MVCVSRCDWLSPWRPGSDVIGRVKFGVSVEVAKTVGNWVICRGIASLDIRCTDGFGYWVT